MLHPHSSVPLVKRFDQLWIKLQHVQLCRIGNPEKVGKADQEKEVSLPDVLAMDFRSIRRDIKAFVDLARSAKTSTQPPPEAPSPT